MSLRKCCSVNPPKPVPTARSGCLRGPSRSRSGQYRPLCGYHLRRRLRHRGVGRAWHRGQKHGQGVQIDEDCSFVAGKWLDPYTGETFTDTADVDIDHVVPLANAWRSGASTWLTADRERYANDPGVLLSTDDGANQEKGDKGPEAWKPPNRSYWCEYARRWVDIKSDWSLTVNEAERAALEEMLETCGAP